MKIVLNTRLHIFFQIVFFIILILLLRFSLLSIGGGLNDWVNFFCEEWWSNLLPLVYFLPIIGIAGILSSKKVGHGKLKKALIFFSIINIIIGLLVVLAIEVRKGFGAGGEYTKEVGNCLVK